MTACVSGELYERPAERLPSLVQNDMSAVLDAVDRSAVPAELLAIGLATWTGTFGLISFELWGHLNGVVTDYDSFFDHQVRRMVAQLGLDPNVVGS